MIMTDNTYIPVIPNVITTLLNMMKIMLKNIKFRIFPRIKVANNFQESQTALISSKSSDIALHLCLLIEF